MDWRSKSGRGSTVKASTWTKAGHLLFDRSSTPPPSLAPAPSVSPAAHPAPPSVPRSLCSRPCFARLPPSSVRWGVAGRGVGGGGGGGVASRSGGRGGQRRCGRGAPPVRPPRSASPGADASARGAGAEPPPPAQRRGPGGGESARPQPPTSPPGDAWLSRPGRDRCAHGPPPPRHPRPAALALPPAHSRRPRLRGKRPGASARGGWGGAILGVSVGTQLGG